MVDFSLIAETARTTSTTPTHDDPLLHHPRSPRFPILPLPRSSVRSSIVPLRYIQRPFLDTTRSLITNTFAIDALISSIGVDCLIFTSCTRSPHSLAKPRLVRRHVPISARDRSPPDGAVWESDWGEILVSCSYLQLGPSSLELYLFALVCLSTSPLQ